MQRNLFIDGSLDGLVALTAAETGRRSPIWLFTAYVIFHSLRCISSCAFILSSIFSSCLCFVASTPPVTHTPHTPLFSQLPFSSYSFLSRLRFFGFFFWYFFCRGMHANGLHLKYNCRHFRSSSEGQRGFATIRQFASPHRRQQMSRTLRRF